MKSISWNLLWAFPLLWTACAERNTTSPTDPTVRLVAATSVNAARASSYPGRTKAPDAADVSFRVSGPIARIPVKVGDHVRRGQVVAQMDDRDYRVQLAATEAEYQQVKAEAERVIALYNDHSTSASNYDRARYGLEQITAKYDNHKNQLADTRLLAPFDGYVQEVLRDEHETVSAGMPVVSIFSADGVEVVIHIPASEYQRRDDWEDVTASFDVLRGQSFPLTVRNVARRANANQLYEVRLFLAAPDAALTPGMTAMVRITYRSPDGGAVEIPAGAMFNTRGTAQVFVYDVATGIIRARDVQVGGLRPDGTAIVTAGLTAGEQVVAAGVHSLRDGQRVQPYPEPTATNVGGML